MGINEIIYKGLKLSTSTCKYFYVHEGSTTSLNENITNSVLELTYLPGSSSLDISKTLGIKHIGGAIEMESMFRPQKFPDIVVSLNGLRLRKLTFDPHVVRIVIVSDSESKVSQDYYKTIIVVSKNDFKSIEFIEYLFFTGGLLFLKPLDNALLDRNWTIKNYPKISLTDRSISLNSDSEVIYSLRSNYDSYVIRSIDYIDKFITELRYRLSQYNIEIVKFNREQTMGSVSYISYRLNQTPVKYNHPKYSDPMNGIIQNRLIVDFELRTPNMILFYDFKNKFSNVDLLTNFCEYKTTDRYGERWTAAIKWGRITEDFNHTYEEDNNSNFSFQCQFNCELYFYEVFDRSVEFLKEIVVELADMEENNK